MITILSQKEIESMRLVCRLAADTLISVKDLIKPGITTQEINDFIVVDTKKKKCIAAPLGYRTENNPKPFPKSVCTSINDEVCHGIPSSRKLVDGDIINIDVTHIFDGWFGDTSATFLVGDVADDVKRLVSVTKQALAIGIMSVSPGVRLGTLGANIQDYVESQGFSIVRDYCGHGIGRKFHDEPNVFHHGTRDRGIRLKPGMIFTIEPIVNMGHEDVVSAADGWTILTKDGLPSAQFEHTVLVTEQGYEILTLPSSV